MGQFEKDLERLETISNQLRSGAQELDEATQLFEEGILLAQKLEQELGKVEKKIQIMINKPAGPEEKPLLELFPELDQLVSDS